MKYTADDYAQLLFDMLSESSAKEQKSITHKFVQTLKAHHQGALLSEIIQSFKKIHDAHQQIIKLSIFSAQPLHNLDQISILLSRELQQNIILHNFVKPEILGGLVIHFQDYKIDFSIQSHLGKIKLQSLTAPPKIPKILEKIISIISAHNGMLFIESDCKKSNKSNTRLISVTTGTRQKLSILEKKFSAALHQKIIVDYHRDPKLIGGVIIEYDHVKIDNSIPKLIKK